MSFKKKWWWWTKWPHKAFMPAAPCHHWLIQMDSVLVPGPGEVRKSQTPKWLEVTTPPTSCPRAASLIMGQRLPDVSGLFADVEVLSKQGIQFERMHLNRPICFLIRLSQQITSDPSFFHTAVYLLDWIQALLVGAQYGTQFSWEENFKLIEMSELCLKLGIN